MNGECHSACDKVNHVSVAGRRLPDVCLGKVGSIEDVLSFKSALLSAALLRNAAL